MRRNAGGRSSTRICSGLRRYSVVSVVGGGGDSESCSFIDKSVSAGDDVAMLARSGSA